MPPASPAHLFAASRPDPAGIDAMARLLMAAKNPAIVAGDDVARAGADKTLVKLVESIGASVWFEGLRGRNSLSDRSSCLRAARSPSMRRASPSSSPTTISC